MWGMKGKIQNERRNYCHLNALLKNNVLAIKRMSIVIHRASDSFAVLDAFMQESDIELCLIK